MKWDLPDCSLVASFQLFVCLLSLFFAAFIYGQKKSLQAHPMYLYLGLTFIGAINYGVRFWGSALCFPTPAHTLAALLGNNYEWFVTW